MHLRTFSYLTQHIFLSAPTGHTVYLLYSHNIRRSIIYHIGYPLKTTNIIHAVRIFNIISHQSQCMLSLYWKNK